MKVITLDIETIPNSEWKGAKHEFHPVMERVRCPLPKERP